MAVLVLALLITGCCTKRDADEIKDRIARLEMQQQTAGKSVARIDSLLAEGAEADVQLRADLRYSMQELSQQISMLLQNYNDLTTRIDALVQSSGQHILRPSPSASGPSTTPTLPVDTMQTQAPAINCDSTYDDAFIMTRRTEYAKAIEGFRQFIVNCPNHANIAKAYYWTGECYYSLEKYNDAITQFQIVVDNYKDSDKVGPAMYKIARSLEEQGKTAEAKKEYQKVADQFPGTLEGEQSLARLKDL